MTRYRRSLKRALDRGGIENAQFEADCILTSVLSCTQAELLAGTPKLLESQWQDCLEIAKKRTRRIPLQYLLKEWEFYGFPFFVGEGVLIPRADTETLCDAAVSLIGNDKAVVLDLCAGSGCITVAVGRCCPNAEMFAVEFSADAVSYLKKNLSRNRVVAEVIQADVTKPETVAACPMADLILCNPPYLTRDEMNCLQPEVTFEPAMALFGGEDGLDFYRSIASLYRRKLRPGGRIFFEIGWKQREDARNILLENGYVQLRDFEDFNGVVRVVSAAVL